MLKNTIFVFVLILCFLISRIYNKDFVNELDKISNLKYNILDKYNNKYKIKLYTNKKEKIIFLKNICIINLNDIYLTKQKQYNIFEKKDIPYPKTYYINKNTNINKLFDNISYPIILKPSDSYGGSDVFCNIKNKEEALDKVQFFYKNNIFPIVVQNHIFGNEYRVLVFNNKVLNIYEKVKPSITGNGKDSIKKLIEEYNIKNKFKKDNYYLDYIKKQNYSLDYILEKEKKINLIDESRPMNLSSGTSIQFISLDKVHPDNLNLFSNFNSKVGMIYGGIDFIIPDISKSYKNNGGVIIEINESPGLTGYPKNYFSNILKLWTEYYS